MQSVTSCKPPYLHLVMLQKVNVLDFLLTYLLNSNHYTILFQDNLDEPVPETNDNPQYNHCRPHNRSIESLGA